MGTARVLFIGLDAMDAGITARLMDDGRMPVLAGLAARSLRAPVANPEGLVVGGVWPTVWSGTGPGTHGFHCFRQLEPGSYEIRRHTPDDIRVPPFWMELARAGRSVAVLDMPLVSPTASEGLVHVVELGTHDRMLVPTSSPADVLPAIVERHGPHPVLGRCDDYAAAGRWEELRDALQAGLRWRTSVLDDLAARGDWDLLATVVSETHCAGHQFWWLHDRSWPTHDAALAASIGDPLVDVYTAVDDALGRLLAHAGPHTHVVVLQSHGIGAHHDGDHLFAEILRRLDEALGGIPPARRVREVALRRAARLVRTARERRHPGDRRFHRVTAVDSGRRFFAVPNNEVHAAVRLNLAGREPRGVVAPGAQADHLLAWLAEELLALREPGTGRPLVRRVLRVDDLHPGPARDALPDLLVDWERSAPIETATSPTIGTVQGRYRGTRTGDHRPAGRILLSGPGIRPAELGRPVVSVDIAPTVAAWLGVTLPGVEGRPLPGAS